MRLQLRTLRVRSIVVAILIALSPLVFVYLGLTHEESAVATMQQRLLAAGQPAVVFARQNDGVATDSWARSRFEKLAKEHNLWLRVVTPEGRVVFGAGQKSAHSSSTSAFERLLAEDPGPLKLADYETSRPPLTEREEFVRALDQGRSALCEYARDGNFLTCVEVRRLEAEDGGRPLLLYLRNGSIQGLRTVAGIEYSVVALVLQVLAVSLVLGVWMGWWSVRPVKQLRQQVAERTRAPVSTEPVDTNDRGEIGELADAFNALLDALQERREANEAFMADIAHEIKNPVAAIKAAAERLDSGELTEKRASRLARVLSDSSQRLDQLVSRFLELAHAEAGLPDEEREPVEFDGLVAALVERFEADERYQDVTFEVSLETASIDGASGHLETAVGNLLQNAVSFAHSTVRVALSSSDEQVVLCVADDGPGIDPDDVPHVFDRFFSRRHDDSGTGLGLAMTRAIVEAHRGRITVDSELGDGTRFEIRLAVSHHFHT